MYSLRAIQSFPLFALVHNDKHQNDHPDRHNSPAEPSERPLELARHPILHRQEPIQFPIKLLALRHVQQKGRGNFVLLRTRCPGRGRAEGGDFRDFDLGELEGFFGLRGHGRAGFGVGR
jgi:hypothetical protein